MVAQRLQLGRLPPSASIMSSSPRWPPIGTDSRSRGRMPALTAANRRISLHISTESVADLENSPYKNRRWDPWQVPYEMVCPETRDVADIPVEAVAKAWERLAPSIWPR